MPAKKARQKGSTHPESKKQYDRDIEKLVRAGVERFIVRDSTIYDFVRTLRSASTTGVSPHPLTKAVFSRIVKDAIKKRKRLKDG